MDFHKLQHVLNDIEPSDRNKDIEMLKRAAQGDNSPAPREEVTESVTPVAREPMDEAAQMAALAGVNSPKRDSNPEMLDEARQMAALAGIPMSEGHKTGKAGQLKGKDKVSKSSPSKTGQQKNVTRGKLVGSTERDEESIEEGPRLDQMKKDWKAGQKDYNNLGSLKGAFGNNKKSKKSKSTEKDTSKTGTKSSEQGLPPKLVQELSKYSTALSNITRNPKLAAQFKELMKAADPNLQLESYMESRKQYDTEKKKSVVESKTTYTNDKDSIKEDLFRRLNGRK